MRATRQLGVHFTSATQKAGGIPLPCKPGVGRQAAPDDQRRRLHNLDEPVAFGERRYTPGCTLDIQGLRRSAMASNLARSSRNSMPSPIYAAECSVRLRRPLMFLDDHDSALLKREVAAETRGEFATQAIAQPAGCLHQSWQIAHGSSPIKELASGVNPDCSTIELSSC